MQYKRPESVLVVIHDKNKRVLALQRQDDSAFWQSVTGAMEADEIPAQTAIREVLEEVGIDIHSYGYQLFDTRQINQYQIRPQWQHRYPPNTKTNTEYAFLLEIDGDLPIVLTEHLAFRWVSPTEAIKLMWSETNKDIIRQFLL